MFKFLKLTLSYLLLFAYSFFVTILLVPIRSPAFGTSVISIIVAFILVVTWLLLLPAILKTTEKVFFRVAMVPFSILFFFTLLSWYSEHPVYFYYIFIVKIAPKTYWQMGLEAMRVHTVYYILAATSIVLMFAIVLKRHKKLFSNKQ